MEISKPHIARLVLGYLKSENCTTAFNEFLTTSQFLKQHAIFVKNGKYFATRVGGLTLEEIISEYSEISFIIQGKLEQTDYYEERRNMNLVGQLIYILDHNFQSHPTLSNDLNTTPSESLPGNSSPKSSKQCTRPAFNECSPIEPDKIDNISQVLSQTLLEKKELHEKLADVINAVQNDAERQGDVIDCASNALDNKIKTIVQKAEQDPIFDEILKEIIDNTTDTETHNPTVDSEPSSQSNINQSQKITTVNTKKKIATPPPSQPSERTEHIPDPSEKGSTTSIVTSSAISNSSEVIIYNGSFDSYVGATAVSQTSVMQPNAQGQFYMTTNTPRGLLMVPSMITAPNYIIVPSQTSNPTSNVLTDTDIMKMPTIILDEGPISTNKEPPQTKPKKRCKILAPKTDNITVSTEDGGYYAVYKDGELVAEEEIPPIKIEEKPRTSLRKRLPRQAKKKTEPKEEKKNPVTPLNKPVANKSTTPGSNSHIRSLNFNSPSKEAEREDSPRKSTLRSFPKFGKKIEKKRRNSEWDADLREMLVPKALSSPDTSDDKLDSTYDYKELEKEAQMIEDAVKTPIKKNIDDEPMIEKDVNNDTTPKTPVIDLTNENQKEERDKPSEPLVDAITVEETAVYLRNCNGPPRFKKKCNISNNTMQKYELEVVIEAEIDGTKKPTETQVSSTSDDRKTVLLETPMKERPKTPTGKDELTPFSKVLEEQLQGMDLLSFPTPNLQMTPSFPVTPCINLNTPVHFNRPTDYSSASSYYQPSDTEQNKSLEIMIEECKKLEQTCAEEVKNKKTDNIKSNDQAVTDIKKVFNESLVAKKNLNLLKRRNSSSSSSDESDSSSSSSDDGSSSSSDSDFEYQPSTETEELDNKNIVYSLRRRSSIAKTTNEKLNQSIRKTPAKPKSVAAEIEDKRNRVIKSLMAEATRTLKAGNKITPQRNKCGKFMKKTQNKSQLESVADAEPAKFVEQVQKACDVENEITDDDFALHLSTDEDSTNKPNAEAASNRNKEESNIVKSGTQLEKETPSDLEAEQLVQGLKERGIHLVHKKSPKKDVTPEKIIENLPAVSTAPISDEKVNKEDLITLNDGNPVDTKDNLDSSLNLSRNDLDITFDIQCFEQYNIEILFDSTKKRARKVVYDSKVLEKEMKANVYIESLDIEMERIIKCTEFDTIFDYPPKKAPSSRQRKRTVKSECCKTDTSKSPKVTNPAKVKKSLSKSILPENFKEQIEINEKTRKVSDVVVKCSESKELKLSSLDQAEKTKKSLNASEISKVELQDDRKETVVKKEVCSSKNSSENQNNADLTKITSNLEGLGEMKSDSSENISISTFNNENANSVSRTAVKNPIEQELIVNPDKSPTVRGLDDELMNYAVLGSQREENSNSPRSGEKRKSSFSGSCESTGKKFKTEQQQALLKKIDVDVFLNKVHGNAGKS